MFKGDVVSVEIAIIIVSGVVHIILWMGRWRAILINYTPILKQMIYVSHFLDNKN